MLSLLVLATSLSAGVGLSLSLNLNYVSRPPPKPKPKPPANSFVVAQYNVLAGGLGSNTHPWFLHGLPDLSDERRAAITARFYRRGSDGRLLKRGWPDHAEGILTEQEMRVVEDVDARYFAWEGRKRRLIRTVAGIDADLLSLVECDHFDDFWEGEMGRLGYDGVYKCRPRRARGSNGRGRSDSDGCAIFFRRGAFDLEAFRGIELEDAAILTSGHDNDGPISRIADSADRVALLALLRHVPTGRRLIFVSTHLTRNPEDSRKTQERARQVAQILYQVTLFAEEHGALPTHLGESGSGSGNEEKGAYEAPVVVAGDLNETSLRHLATMARIKFGLAQMDCHPFVFTSRVAAVPRSSLRKIPTSVTSSRSMRIDYILLQPSLLHVCEDIIPNQVEDDNAIPNEQHPSDHIPVASRVSFRDRRSASEGCAASWVEGVAQAKRGRGCERPALAPGSVLRLDEMETAFDYFDGIGNCNGVCDPTELSLGLKRLGVGGILAEATLKDLSRTRILTLDEFRGVYLKSWLRQQCCFLDRVRSVRTMFDLNVASSEFASKTEGNEEESGDLFAEMDVDGDGAVYVEDVISFLRKVEKSEDSIRARVKAAFFYFDFDPNGEFTLQELYQCCCAAACPFKVSMELLHDAFDDMGKSYNERVQLDDFIDWFTKIYFIKDTEWISLVGPIPK